MATPILALPAATDRIDAALERNLERVEAAEVALGRARQALDDADFLIDAVRELVDVFPGSHKEKREAGGQLGGLARSLDRLEAERSRVSGTARTRACLSVNALTAALGEGWNEKKVYRWLHAGRFPGVTQPGGPGSEYVIPADTVERLMAQDRNGKEA